MLLVLFPDPSMLHTEYGRSMLRACHKVGMSSRAFVLYKERHSVAQLLKTHILLQLHEAIHRVNQL